MKKSQIRQIFKEELREVLKKPIKEASNKGTKYEVFWVDRDYKSNAKSFYDNPQGAPENGLKKAKMFLKKLEDKDKKDKYGLYRDLGVRTISEGQVTNESTGEYRKTLAKIAKDKQLKMLSKKDKETLLKIAQMMKSANESVNESDNWKTVKDKSGDTLKPGKKYTMDGYDGEITFIRFDRDNKTLHLKSNKMGKIRTSIDNVKDMKLVESVNEAFKKGDLVMYDGKGLHGRKSGTRGKVIKIGGGKATMKYGKAKDQVEVVPIKALRNPLTQQHFKSSTEMKKFSNDLNESFSDGSPESQERIKKYSEVLGYSLVGELDEPSFKLREAKLLRFFNEFIAKQGEKWVVKSKAGKTLGTHATKDEAIKQLAAVEISKKKN